MNPVIIDTLPTPNPHALMFKCETPLVERGTFEYTSAERAVEAPLPRKLFLLSGVEQVLVTSRFVTVNKAPDYHWPDLVPSIKDILRAHLASGEEAVPPDQILSDLDTSSALARQISELIDDEVRPALAMDGGDVQFVGITDDMVVQLRLVGSCSSCPSSTATLAFGIERLLVEEFPDLSGVVQV